MNELHPVSFEGPLERHPFPEKLTARVITPGARPRLFGYDVEGDLARFYGIGELVLLSLTGELPSEVARRGFEVALMFAAPISVDHASTHAAVLSRLCGSPTSATVGAAAIGLAEQARVQVAQHAELFAWLEQGAGRLPLQFVASDAADAQAVARLHAALPPELLVPGLADSPTRDAAMLCVLHAVGLRQPEQVEAALTLARLPSTLAEAFAERAANFGSYPATLPVYRYEECP
jgi:hypothetical protein